MKATTKTRARPTFADGLKRQNRELLAHMALLQADYERMRQDAGVRAIQAERRATELKEENVALRKAIVLLATVIAGPR